ncbi:MAG: hypothetical protein MRZ17_02605 [Acholeplasmataceae bacterium]|nr:hypothetical protein [Acholeplasmataceae bacterium]
MIYSFKDQLLMIIYFIIVGMFIGIMFDTINLFFYKNKIINYIFQVLCWLVVTIICVISVDRISDGYLPVYIFFFFIIGYFIYSYIFKGRYKKRILYIKKYKGKIKQIILPIELIALFKKKNKKNQKSN